MVEINRVIPPDTISCDIARALQAQLVAGQIDPSDRKRLAIHSKECSSCAEELGDSLALASGLMGSERLGREERWAIREAYARSRRTPSRVSPGGKRLMLYVLAATLLLFGSSLKWFGTGSSWFVAGSPQLTALRGEVYLSDALLPIDEATLVSVGRVVELRPDSRALLVRGKAQIEMEGTTAVRIEAHEPLSVNLVHGWTRCVGPCRIRTPSGLVILDAGDEVLVHVTDTLVTLEGMDGETVASSASVTKTVSRGEVLRIER